MAAPFKLNYAQGLYEQLSDQKETLGCPRWTDDGRFFRYAAAGSSSLAAGKMGIAPTVVAHHINKSVAAAAIGDMSVDLTVGATLVSLDQYKDGWLMVNDGTGQGHSYPISGNSACTSEGTTTVQLKDPIRVALVASATSEASLFYNPYDAVTESTTQTSLPVGVPLVAVTAAYFYWAQTGGIANCLIEGTPAVGTRMILSDSVGGALEAENTTLDIDEPTVGYLYSTAGVDTEYKPVDLNLN